MFNSEMPSQRLTMGSDHSLQPDDSSDGGSALSMSQASVASEEQLDFDKPVKPKLKANISKLAQKSKTQAKSVRKPKVAKRKVAAKETPMNWQRKAHVSDRMGKLSFMGAIVSDDRSSITLADGLRIEIGDHVYVLSEPMGEPYYLARVIEFIPAEKVKENSLDLNDHLAARVNWLYRPGDVHKKRKNTRELLLTMQSDVCQLASFRGKCTVRCLSEIEDLDRYQNTPNCFWVSQMWDRYIERLFDVLPTSKVTNMPEPVINLLRARFRYIVVEPQFTKRLCVAPRSCAECGFWATDEDSVRCSGCNSTSHYACLEPPLKHKLTRGFGWSCAHCVRELVPEMSDTCNESTSSDQEFLQKINSNMPALNTHSYKPEPEYKSLLKAVQTVSVLTPEQEKQLRLWPFRYLGMHTTIEDIIDVNDRIYPRAASRIGPKHQAVVPAWPGRPAIYYRVRFPGRRGKRGHAKAANSSKAIYDPPDLDRTLPWVQETPSGYIERGGDNTSTLMWSNRYGVPDEFLKKTEAYATQLDISLTSPNFLDACLKAFIDAKGNDATALKEVSTFTPKMLKEPKFTEEEVVRFEEGIARYGSELHLVFKHVKTKSSADIVRFYYMWKKTPSGKLIWNDCQARGTRRRPTEEDLKFAAAIADDDDPETMYSNEKIKFLGKYLECKFCDTRTSKVWRKGRGPLPSPDSISIPALCSRCSRLWYRYAVVWEPPTSVLKQASQKGAGRMLVEPELLEDAQAIMAEREKDSNRPRSSRTKRQKIIQTEEVEEPVAATPPATDSPSKKRVKLERKSNEASDAEESDKQTGFHGVDEKNSVEEQHPIENLNLETAEKKISTSYEEKKRAPEPANYCVVCCELDPTFSQLNCQACGLCVHQVCYGCAKMTIDPDDIWFCDCCRNDMNPRAEMTYICALCPTQLVLHTAWLSAEVTGVSDALKQTSDNRWAHIRCAVWLPKVTFGEPDRLWPVDVSWEEDSTLACDSKAKEDRCDICMDARGHLAGCDICSQRFHVSCAGMKGYAFGFEFRVATSDAHITEFADRKGVMSAKIRCSDHDIGDLIPMSEMSMGKTALQCYVEKYKQGYKNMLANARKAQLWRGNSRTHTFADGPLIIGPTFSPKQISLVLPKITCICGVTNAAYWFNMNPEKPPQCPKCYWREQGSDAYPEVLNLSELAESTGFNEASAKALDQFLSPRPSTSNAMSIQNILS